MTKVAVDRFDLDLLAELQRDGHATNAALGEKIHLSTSQVSRRIQRLEEAQVITGYTAVLDPETLGLGLVALTQVCLGHQGQQAEQFEAAIADIPEILECLAVTGEADYVVRIVAPDLASFSDFINQRLLRLPGVASVKSIITLKTVKRTSRLPLDHITQPVREKRRVVYHR